jgi:acetylornithine deacetylase/succinyl-diaminopimelate desuccinylase-like protein
LAANAAFRTIPSVPPAVHGRAEIVERLLAWLQPREDEMAALLGELVAVPTENPPGKNYRACVDVLERKLCNAGLACERHEFPAPLATPDAATESSPSLTASFGNGTRTLYFHGHYDVVPAQSLEQFQPVRKEHFLFGRGACDMKGGIVSMLYAVRALKECGVELNGKIALTLVPDEETGGARGSAWLAAQDCWGATESACSWRNQRAAWYGTRTVARFRCG